MPLTLGLDSFIPILSLILFIGGLGFYWLMSFFILYHLIRFGIGTAPKQLSFIFLIGSIVLTLLTAVLFVNLNLNTFTKPLLGS